MGIWKRIYQQYQMQEGLQGGHWTGEQSGEISFVRDCRVL